MRSWDGKGGTKGKFQAASFPQTNCSLLPTPSLESKGGWVSSRYTPGGATGTAESKPEAPFPAHSASPC